MTRRVSKGTIKPLNYRLGSVMEECERTSLTYLFLGVAGSRQLTGRDEQRATCVVILPGVNGSEAGIVSIRFRCG